MIERRRLPGKQVHRLLEAPERHETLGLTQGQIEVLRGLILLGQMRNPPERFLQSRHGVSIRTVFGRYLARAR